MKILIEPVEVYPVYDVVFKSHSDIEEFGDYSHCYNYEESEVKDDFAENAKRVLSEYKKLQEELKAIYSEKWEEEKRRKYTGVQVSKAANNLLDTLSSSDAKLNL